MIYKYVETAQNFMNGSRAPFRVRFDQEGTGDPVGVNPRIPVIDGVFPGVPTHPPIVITLEGRIEQLAVNLFPDTRTDQLGNGIELFAEHMVDSRELSSGLAHAEIDSGIGDVR